ncbi:hypothetical protein [Streptomyces scabiei]|uniref:hypothetical protein n=1 Tax=Streptomyces scabiei TaxID=1930 RepID=UPI0029B753EC|nr:hypothetical protein [Streptomyces scabiei]MDX3033012.1 hypothetical protein [Streptomyces scabiei]
MTADERRAYIRRIVDAAPTLTPEDADFVRSMFPLNSRTVTRRQHRRTPQPARPRTAAA